MSQELPIRREDSDEAAREFLRHWSPKLLAEKGLHQAVRDLLYELQDHGDIVILTVDEGHALSEWLCDEGIGMEVFEDNGKYNDKLKSAVKKLLFANARCFGLMDVDMGIEEPDG